MSFVRVYNGELFDEMVLDSQTAKPSEEDTSPRFPTTNGSLSRAGSIAQSSFQNSEHRRRRHESHHENRKRMQEESIRKTRELQVRNEIRRDEKFRDCYSDLQEGKALANRIGESLHLQEANERNKNRRVFEEWNTKVYGNIQKQIGAKVNSMDDKEVNARRCLNMQKFLDTTNAKSAVFRDIIIESEYDPLEPNRTSIKVDSSGIKDPCKQEVQKHLEEQSLLKSQSEMRLLKNSKTREILDVEHWGNGKIQATPHGYFAKLMSNEAGAYRPKNESNTFKSSLVFDHYNIPRGKAVTDREMPYGKKSI